MLSVRKGAVSVMDDIFDWGARKGCEDKDKAKYLRNAVSWNGKCKHNVEERVRAMKDGYCVFMKYWGREGVRLKTRVLIFRSVVYNIALSGLEACAMEKIQEGK